MTQTRQQPFSIEKSLIYATLSLFVGESGENSQRSGFELKNLYSDKKKPRGNTL